MDMSGQFKVDRPPEYSELAKVSDDDVRQTMLERSLRDPFKKRLSNILPLLMIAYTAANTSSQSFVWQLVVAQSATLILAAVIVTKLLKAFEQDKDSRTINTLWLFTEGLAGAIWGAMLLAITDPSIIGHSLSVYSFTICASVIAGCIIAATAPGLSQAQIIGFSLTAIPIAAYYQDILGWPVLLALIAMPFGVWICIVQVHDQAHRGIKTEIKNVLLARHLAEALQVADFISRHDSLTSLLNRRELVQSAHNLRQNDPEREAVVILLDLDHFKAINDRFGHASGDLAIKKTAKILLSSADENNMAYSDSHAIARWGGEEFVVLLADTTIKQAEKFANSIRAKLIDHKCAKWPSNMSLTASFGSTSWRSGECIEQAIARADRAMYKAKENGRNRLVYAE
jgi:diguanylate cyclase (GGDEF)-like protein